MMRRPPVRFLARASLLFLAMLVLWGAFLLDPLRAGLRLFTAAVFWLIPGGSAEVATLPNGDWSLKMPVPAAIGRQPGVQEMFRYSSTDNNTRRWNSQGPGTIHVRSATVVIEGKYPMLFTAGLPFFWALLLAAGWTGRTPRALVLGSTTLFSTAVLSLVFFTISAGLKNMYLVNDSTVRLMLDAGSYFIVNVIPYLMPLGLAFYLDPSLRTQIFSRSTENSDSGGPKGRRQAPMVDGAPRLSGSGRRVGR
jgi:hypothetical protein